jgi:hypothetical protein
MIPAFALWVVIASAAAGQAPGGSRARDVLPVEDLIESSVAVVRDQAALNAHYYLADETVLGLDATTEAVFARYRTAGRDALLLAVFYPSEEDAEGAYGRFGRDFFSESFAPGKSRYLEKLETGDYAAALWRGPFLVVVLEAPDRASCDRLLGRADKKAIALI